MSVLKLKTAPAVEPVTAADIKQHLGITQLSDINRDAEINERIPAARQWLESQLDIVFITQTWTLYADNFTDFFDLKANLQSVTSVKYVDSDGILQTLAADQYRADTNESRLYTAYGVSWPSTRYNDVNAVEIEHISGYGLAAAVPEQIKLAIKFMVAHWENYQSQIEAGGRIQTLPYAIMQLAHSEKSYRNAI